MLGLFVESVNAPKFCHPWFNCSRLFFMHQLVLKLSQFVTALTGYEHSRSIFQQLVYKDVAHQPYGDKKLPFLFKKKKLLEQMNLKTSTERGGECCSAALVSLDKN